MQTQTENNMPLTMNSTMTMDRMPECTIPNGPSADFICAISEFLDTDPKDLLTELGYYAIDSTDSLENHS